MGLVVHQCGPALAIQDMGRTGHLAAGMMRGGASDTKALYEGAALLNQSPDCAALEMVGIGGTFQATADLCIALTGASMRTSLNGSPIVWNASHAMQAGDTLTIGPTLSGTYGYLHVSGGIGTDPIIASRAAHLTIGLGALIKPGDALPVGPLKDTAGQCLPRDKRFEGGEIRIVPSAQTNRFPDHLRTRFEQTLFRRDPRANRQAIRLDFEGDGFSDPSGLSIVSEIVTPGDIQIAGDGTPYILSIECQTTGGYPRIGTVIPSDFGKVVQTPAGRELRFRFISIAAARDIETRARVDLQKIKTRITPLLRDPHEMKDLLSYNLISGAIAED